MTKQKSKKKNKNKNKNKNIINNTTFGSIVLYSYAWSFSKKRRGKVLFQPNKSKNCSILKTRLNIFSTEIFNIWAKLEEENKYIFNFKQEEYLDLMSIINNIYDDEDMF